MTLLHTPIILFRLVLFDCLLSGVTALSASVSLNRSVMASCQKAARDGSVFVSAVDSEPALSVFSEHLKPSNVSF